MARDLLNEDFYAPEAKIQSFKAHRAQFALARDNPDCSLRSRSNPQLQIAGLSIK